MLYTGAVPSHCSRKDQYAGHFQLTSISRAKCPSRILRYFHTKFSKTSISPPLRERQASPPGVLGTSSCLGRGKAFSYSSSTPQPDMEQVFHTAQCKVQEASLTFDHQFLLLERSPAAETVDLILPNVGRRGEPPEGQKGSSGISPSGLLPLEPH